MTEYYNKQMFLDAVKQRKKVLMFFYAIVVVYLIACITMLIWYTTLPFGDENLSKVKLIMHAITIVTVAFCGIYLGIPYKRVNRFYKLTAKMYSGIKETYTGSFLEYDESLANKDGVDVKSLVFVEWNKYKKDFFERKVYVFNELPFPQLEPNRNYKYVTQGNVLISYEILS